MNLELLEMEYRWKSDAIIILVFIFKSYKVIIFVQSLTNQSMQNRYNSTFAFISDRKNNHFEQNFEQSSVNVSDSNLNNSRNPNEMSSQACEGEAIQLLQIKPNGKIQVNNEALDIIASYNDKPVGFVALVGKYRTGKSFLLNKLLFLQKNGFKVSQYTQACTHGIWMWSNPFDNEYLGNYLFFIDTQGLASLQKGEQNDIKIFTLATLISSYLVYNSVGCIDERSISDLSAITKLSKNIMTEQRLSVQQNQRRLKDFMPSFCWVIRDFTLQLKDQRQRSITPMQYLQNSLRDENSLVRINDETKSIKKSLLTLFKDRDCLTLVRPARQQTQIQSLNKISDVYLRREFIDGINGLREKIQRKAGCKMFEGKQLNGNDMACMIEAYAQTINEGKIPTIKSAWQQIADNEGDTAFSMAHQKYLQVFDKYFGNDEPKQQRELNKHLSNMREQAITEFRRNCSSQNQQHGRKLRDWIDKQEQTIRQANQNAISSRNLQILKDESHGLMRKVQQNYYIGKKDEYLEDLDTVLKNYRRKAIGDKKQGLLVDFLAATNKIGINLEKKPETYQNNQYLVKQAQLKMKIQQEQNKSKSNQADLNNKLTQREQQKQKKTAQMRKKKQEKAGCCGGKCQIY